MQAPNLVYRKFQAARDAAQGFKGQWQQFSKRFIDCLEQTQKAGQVKADFLQQCKADIAALHSSLEEALQALNARLDSPLLTLATTGTTSSGKSTLVNFLCGAELVPVAVSEMSAGTVTLEDGDVPSLTIEATPGALWECGTWENISAATIYDKLEEAMVQYLDTKDTNPSLAPPKANITYPIQFLRQHRHQLGLPFGTRVQLLDLPGFAYVGDERNAQIIREQCRQALCLVTYNSAETDAKKTEQLLEEVVIQVKNLGGSPARMLFVLNRIDVFQEDRDPQKSEQRFVSKTVGQIKAKLKEKLPEHEEAIETLKVLKLSARAALYSQLIQQSVGEERAKICERAEEQHKALIGEDLLEELPRNPAKWTDHDCQRVAESLWANSYGQELFKELVEQIQQHFAELVIPQIVVDFNKGAANKVLEWCTQEVDAICNSIEEKYRQECERLEETGVQLSEKLQQAGKNLKVPFEEMKELITSHSPITNHSIVLLESIMFEFIGNKEQTECEPEVDDNDDDEWSDKIRQWRDKIQQWHSQVDDEWRDKIKLDDEILPLIYTWRREVFISIEQLLEQVYLSIQGGKVDFSADVNLKQLPPPDQKYVQELEETLREFIEFIKAIGYNCADVAKQGMTIRQETQGDFKIIYFQSIIKNIQKRLSEVIEVLVKSVLAREQGPIYDVVSLLFRNHLEYLQESAQRIAPELGIQFPMSTLSQVQKELNWDIFVEKAFSPKKATWTTTERRKAGPRSLLCLIEIETKVNVKKSGFVLEVPSMVKLCEDWSAACKEWVDEYLVPAYLDWLLEQTDLLTEKANEYQQAVLERYRSKLSECHQALSIDYETHKQFWELMRTSVAELEQARPSWDKIK
ncbi:dynamin family protein [Thermosynechococcus vestitus]|uniref:Tlr0362 protein n=1 Tax=Thermosynechococcus vestitus (strain NIES-2133 / IAM M-273 / BP-1) TaxID=197221 RepID=Q8DLW4_THEVB|nr:dynamin family protein [Thermosynechococcus vestitus]BAC07914.1 tlr0362 [Thermosynechococcus vestitus BP-1]